MRLSPLDVIVVGALAGALSKTVTAPIDRVRIIFQVDRSQSFTLRRAYSVGAQIVKDAGPQGLWKGNLAMLWRVVPFDSLKGNQGNHIGVTTINCFRWVISFKIISVE